MEIPDLAALVSGLMERHPGCRWRVLSGYTPGEDLVIEMYPAQAPDRVATIRVLRGLEVFTLSFAGHEGNDYAYSDAERVEVLQDRIYLGVAASVGPSQVILDRANEVVVRSLLVIDPDGEAPQEEGETWPVRRLKARLLGRPITREVIDFPALTPGHHSGHQ